MSSILKALKKLDAEKSAREPDSIKIDAEILRGETQVRFSPLGMVLAATLLFACGGVATYLYLKPETGEIVSKRIAPLPVIPEERIIPDAIVPAVRMPSGKNSPATPATAGTSPSPLFRLPDHPPEIKPDSRTIAKPRPIRTVHLPKATAGASAAPAKGPGRPQTPMLRVNGIAFQDGVDSVAMINEVQVVKGATIEGVRVVDIKKDRVIFSINGENFEIALGRSNR